MTIPQHIIDANKRLRESREPIPVREMLAGPVVRMGDQPTEGKSRGSWLAKISHADRVNQNRRVYTRELWQQTIDLLKKHDLLAQGKIIGAMDHASWIQSGNLGDTCVVWRDIWMDADGAVWGRYDVIEGSSKGDDLKAMKKAGVSIGWSTSGYGTAHDPGETEEEKYGDGRGSFVVMDLNYELKKVDAVDDPSCHDAWDTSESAGRPRLTGQNEGKTPLPKEPPMKTFDDLKKSHPELASAIEAENKSATESAVAAAVASAIAPLNSKIADLESTSKKAIGLINSLVAGTKEVAGVELPQVEILPAETAARISALEGELKAANDKVASAEKGKTEAEQKLAVIDAEKAESARIEKVRAKFESVAADSAFKAGLAKALEKQIANKSFTEGDVEAFVKETVELFESAGVRPEGGPSHRGPIGKPPTQATEGTEDESPDGVAAFAG